MKNLYYSIISILHLLFLSFIENSIHSHNVNEMENLEMNSEFPKSSHSSFSSFPFSLQLSLSSFLNNLCKEENKEKWKEITEISCNSPLIFYGGGSYFLVSLDKHNLFPPLTLNKNFNFPSTFLFRYIENVEDDLIAFEGNQRRILSNSKESKDYKKDSKIESIKDNHERGDNFFPLPLCSNEKYEIYPNFPFRLDILIEGGFFLESNDPEFKRLFSLISQLVKATLLAHSKEMLLHPLPWNLFYDPRGRLKILDLRLASSIPPSDSNSSIDSSDSNSSSTSNSSINNSSNIKKNESKIESEFEIKQKEIEKYKKDLLENQIKSLFQDFPSRWQVKIKENKIKSGNDIKCQDWYLIEMIIKEALSRNSCLYQSSNSNSNINSSLNSNSNINSSLNSNSNIKSNSDFIFNSPINSNSSNIKCREIIEILSMLSNCKSPLPLLLKYYNNDSLLSRKDLDILKTIIWIFSNHEISKNRDEMLEALPKFKI